MRAENSIWQSLAKKNPNFDRKSDLPCPPEGCSLWHAIKTEFQPKISVVTSLLPTKHALKKRSR
jgi:hypothetical protein